MRTLFCLLLIIFSIQSRAAEYDTLDGQIKIRFKATSTVYGWALARYPSWWLTEPNRKAKTIIFMHGSGEAGSGEDGLANLSVHSVPDLIKRGIMPQSFTNPRTGAQEEFLFISIQTTTGGIQIRQLWYAIDNSPNFARIDKNNISFITLSLGSRTISSHFADQRKDTLARIRSIVLMSSPKSNDETSPFTLTGPGMLTDQKKPLFQIWSLTDPVSTVLTWNAKLRDSMQLRSPETYTFRNYGGGHCCWSAQSSPNTRQVVAFPWGVANVNVYEWILGWSYDGLEDRFFRPGLGIWRLS